MGKKLLRRGGSMIAAAAVVVGVVVGGVALGTGTASAACIGGGDGGCDNDPDWIELPEPVREALLVVLTALLPAAEAFDSSSGSASWS